MYEIIGKVFAISLAPREPQPLRYRLGPLCCTMSSVPLNINDGECGRLGHGHCIVCSTCTIGHRAGPTFPISIESICVVLTCCSMDPQGSFTFLLQKKKHFPLLSRFSLHALLPSGVTPVTCYDWRLLMARVRLHSCWCKLNGIVLHSHCRLVGIDKKNCHPIQKPVAPMC